MKMTLFYHLIQSAIGMIVMHFMLWG